MIGVTANDVIITYVTSGYSRRLLERFNARRINQEAVDTSISTLYTVAALSQYSQSTLESQLANAVADGTFTSQLQSFAKQFGANAFMNATSTALVFITSAPTSSPSQSISEATLSGAVIAGIVAASIVFIALIAGAIMYICNRVPVPLPTGSFTSRHRAMDIYAEKKSMSEFINPIFLPRTRPRETRWNSDIENTVENVENVQNINVNLRSERDSVDIFL